MKQNQQFYEADRKREMLFIFVRSINQFEQSPGPCHRTEATHGEPRLRLLFYYYRYDIPE